MMYKQAMQVPVLLMIVGVTFMLCGQVSTSCSCSGYVTSKGRGECNTSYKGKKYCYVNPGQCSDQIKGSSSNRFWSYQACEKMEQQCYTVRGNQCQFPFSYKGRTFSSCTTFDSENKAAWCTTTEGRYEDCVSPCGVSSNSLASCPKNPVIKELSRNCCTEDNPCGEGEGDCDTDNQGTCQAGLRCGDSNCGDFNPANYALADCCYKPMNQGQYYNVNEDGYITCQTREDCPPDFYTGLSRVSYSCGDSWIEDICSQTLLPDITCGSGQLAKSCSECGTTEETCGDLGQSLPGYCVIVNEERNGPTCTDYRQAEAGAFPLTWSSAIGGTGSSSAINPERYDECGPRYCRRGNKCCLLVYIGWSNRYLGCPQYC
eukprot:GFUD01042981.1.p1 GENE.GFUD01042981.1~~GFUD01042981.1.p1  ORF type:complete len:373 (+),score=63.63 GFUD01042981.1:80-1198(+)